MIIYIVTRQSDQLHSPLLEFRNHFDASPKLCGAYWRVVSRVGKQDGPTVNKTENVLINLRSRLFCLCLEHHGWLIIYPLYTYMIDKQRRKRTGDGETRMWYHQWQWNQACHLLREQCSTASRISTNVLINKSLRGTLQDVRVLRGADAGSDHSLILIKLKLKLRKAKKVEQRSLLLDVQKLKDPVKKRVFQPEVRNRFEVLQDQQQLDLNTVIQEALGLRGRKKEEWISATTVDAIGKTKAT